MRKIYLLLLSFLSLSLIFLFSCQPTPSSSNNVIRGFTFKRPNKKFLTLKFRLINNLVVIPIRINNSDTLHFILDSGVQSMLITELGVGDKLQVEYLREITLSGLGAGEELKAYASPNNNFNISGIIGHNQDLLILKEDIFHLSSRFGIRIHGIMGYSIFADFVVKINYDSKIITFYNKEKYKYKRKKRDVIIPIKIIDAKPYIWANLEQGIQNDSVAIPVKLLIDTGGGHAIWLDASSNEKLEIPEKRKEAYLGKGMRGDVTGFLGRSRRLSLAEIELENITTAFPDSSSIASVKGQGSRNGSLGAEVLRRFDVVMDYTNERMILRRNGNFSNSFNYNMAGIEVASPIPNSNIYLISHIEKDSPASKLNIKKNDQIMRINGVSVRKYSIHDIYKLFRSKEGRKITLDLRRDGNALEQWRVEFTLENPI